MQYFSDRDKLFRKEVLEKNNKVKTLGEVLLRQPPEYKWIAYILFVAISVFVVYLFMGNYAKHATVFGVITVDKGVVKLSASREGKIEQQLFNEGDIVAKGQLLYVISTERHSSLDKNLDQNILLQQQQLNQSLQEDIKIAEQKVLLDKQLLSDRIIAKKSEIKNLQQQLVIYDERLVLALKSLQRNEKLLASGHTNQAQIDNVYEDYLALKTKRNDLNLKVTNSETKLTELNNDLALMPAVFNEKINLLERKLIENEQRIVDASAKIDYRIYAPTAGVIATQHSVIGEYIKKGELIGSLIPANSTLQAELYVPASSIGFIKEGQQVAMRYSAFPYQHFGLQQGQVASVSKVISLPEELQTSVELSGAVYKVVVSLASQNIQVGEDLISLGVGMELEASVKLEDRSLVQWILEPIYSLRDS